MDTRCIRPVPGLRSVSTLWPDVEHFVVRRGRRRTGDLRDFLALKGNDLIVFHVLDPQELAFDFAEPRQFEPCQFEDLETGERIPVVPERIRAGYKGLIESHVAQIARLMGESRVDYCQTDTARPLDHALYDYLSRRQRLQRVR